jgi:hypothetical protein
VKAAYADPPYLGCGAKHYGALHEQASDYDDPETHRRLIERLCDEFDSWALSLHEPSLRVLLPMCPTNTRVGAWVKPFASFKANVTRAYAWEPVIFSFHRPRNREQDTWRDFVSEPIAMRRGFPGAKPDKVCFWLFEGMNLVPGDEFHDLFPGSGAVGEAWSRWCSRTEPTQLEMHE